MAKIDLKSISGLPVIYESDKLLFKDFAFKEKVTVTLEDVREQLLNQSLDCPDIFYEVYKWVDYNSIFKSKKIRVNLYTMKPNLAGVEYVKTKVTRCKKYPRIIEILYGSSIILIQKYKSPKENRIIKIVARKGQKIIIPSGYDFVAVNIRHNSPLIFAEYLYTKAISRIVLDDQSGMAYYVIRKNAKQEIVRNSNYKIVNEVEKMDMEKIITKTGITPKTPVIKQILRKYEKFDWLFKKDSISI